MRRVVKGVRVHPIPRKKLFDHDRFHDCNRLSVMLSEEGNCVFKDENTDRHKDDTPAGESFWCGLTVFYHDIPDEKGTMKHYYLDTPVGIVKTPLTYEEALNVEDVYASWILDAKINTTFLLTMKEGMKELDPTRFDEREQRLSDEADLAEWRQWIANKAVDLVENEQDIGKDKVVSAPMRYVRVNRGQDGEIEMKSRLVIPGHTDPQLGLFRTDSPTTSGLAVLVCTVIALAYDWSFLLFDVMTAFLSGMQLTRELYAKAPREGLPACSGWPRIAPYRLLRLLKGAYGLTEAPRLWYLKAREILVEKIGFEELQCAPSVFVKRAHGTIVALLTLHVDDGMLCGNAEGPEFKKIRADIDQHFKIKHWKLLNDSVPEDYLGEQWFRFEDRVEIFMNKYVRELYKHKFNKKDDIDDRDLTESEMHSYKSILAKVRWPVARIAPGLAYGVSALAQRNPKGRKVVHMKALNEIIDRLQDMDNKGKAKLIIRKIDIQHLMVLTVMDASFAQEVGCKSQMGFMYIMTDTTILKGEATCALVEFQSSVITRVVGSTMAAESAALSVALDRQLYLRLLIESILHGTPNLRDDWRLHLRIPGTLVTDAKSLYDHIGKVGSMPTSRQTLIDLLVARDLVEQKAIMLKWLPNTHMLADILTKATAPTPVLIKFLEHGLFSLVPTVEQESHELHRLRLRQGQRERAKEKKKARKAVAE